MRAVFQLGELCYSCVSCYSFRAELCYVLQVLGPVTLGGVEDGREQVVLTVFLRPPGPGERALSTVARRGFAPITFSIEIKTRDALATKSITKTAR